MGCGFRFGGIDIRLLPGPRENPARTCVFTGSNLRLRGDLACGLMKIPDRDGKRDQDMGVTRTLFAERETKPNCNAKGCRGQ
jgi:hypothetical protein